MNIHHYHPETGAYLGAGLADESPLQPGVFLVPAHATVIPPPLEQDGFVLRYADGVWVYSPTEDADEPPSDLPPTTPPSLTRLTFWLAAAEIGVTKAGIRAHIDAMPEGVEKFQALAYFEEAQVYRREDPLLIQMAAVEGITEPQLDALWAWAAQAYP